MNTKEIIERAEAKAEQCQIEASIYRRELEDLKALADSATEDNCELVVNRIAREAASALQSETIKEWCIDWRTLWESDIQWLKDALRLLKQIKVRSQPPGAKGEEQTVYLNNVILEALDCALIQRPSNVDLDELNSMS